MDRSESGTQGKMRSFHCVQPEQGLVMLEEMRAVMIPKCVTPAIGMLNWFLM